MNQSVKVCDYVLVSYGLCDFGMTKTTSIRLCASHHSVPKVAGLNLYLNLDSSDCKIIPNLAQLDATHHLPHPYTLNSMNSYDFYGSIMIYCVAN